MPDRICADCGEPGAVAFFGGKVYRCKHEADCINNLRAQLVDARGERDATLRQMSVGARCIERLSADETSLRARLAEVERERDNLQCTLNATVARAERAERNSAQADLADADRLLSDLDRVLDEAGYDSECGDMMERLHDVCAALAAAREREEALRAVIIGAAAQIVLHRAQPVVAEPAPFLEAALKILNGALAAGGEEGRG